VTSLLRALAAGTPEMAEAFGDAATLGHALAFEQALAKAQAAEGLISTVEAEAVAHACAQPLDLTSLAHEAAHAGTLAIPLVAELKRLGARRAHLGATSQDLADTVLMLQAKAGLALIEADVARVVRALKDLAIAHGETPMLARTLLQPALPTTFGMKAAQWALLAADSGRRLRSEAGLAVRLQLGGAVGALHGMQGGGAGVAASVAASLGLPVAVPWHARRDAVAGLGGALGILAGAMGKIALDVALLAQAEVGEAFEPQVEGRGGSSAMAHKRNPAGCQVALSAAHRAPHLAATLLAGLPQAHERGLGDWQAEAPVMAELFLVTHGAVRAMALVAEGLEVRPAAMRRNLEAAGVGFDLGEARRLMQAALDAAEHD